MSSRLFLNTFLLAASTVPSFASVSEGAEFCGSHVSSDTQYAIRTQFSLDKRTLIPRAAAPDCANAAANLNVHFHVVYANKTYDGGYLEDDQIATQIAFLNSEWGKFAPLTFTLVNTTRTQNEDGFLYAREKVSDIRTGVVTPLHTGGVLDINVYTVSFSVVPDLRGFSSFPWDSKNDTIDDGIFIKWNSLPGGTLKSNGGSLVHEVGHWLGLYHTWQNGCTTPNDEVDDTPAEDPINANRGLQTCPASFDSCPDLPGQDPIHNYMTYASDDCRTEFTKGQVARLLEQSQTYRGLTLACPSTTNANTSNTSGRSVSSGSVGRSTGAAAADSAVSSPSATDVVPTTSDTGSGGALSTARPWTGLVAGVVGLVGGWVVLA